MPKSADETGGLGTSAKSRDARTRKTKLKFGSFLRETERDPRGTTDSCESLYASVADIWGVLALASWARRTVISVCLHCCRLSMSGGFDSFANLNCNFIISYEVSR
jgi:hypothetical protein